jgi:hypothetical protein
MLGLQRLIRPRAESHRPLDKLIYLVTHTDREEASPLDRAEFICHERTPSTESPANQLDLNIGELSGLDISM